MPQLDLNNLEAIVKAEYLKHKEPFYMFVNAIALKQLVRSLWVPADTNQQALTFYGDCEIKTNNWLQGMSYYTIKKSEFDGFCKAEIIAFNASLSDNELPRRPLIHAKPKCTCSHKMSGGCFADCDRNTHKEWDDTFKMLNGKISLR